MRLLQDLAPDIIYQEGFWTGFVFAELGLVFAEEEKTFCKFVTLCYICVGFEAPYWRHHQLLLLLLLIQLLLLLLLFLVRLRPLWPPVCSRQRPNALLASFAPAGLGLLLPPPLQRARLQAPQQHWARSCAAAGTNPPSNLPRARTFSLVPVFRPTAGDACFVFPWLK